MKTSSYRKKNKNLWKWIGTALAAIGVAGGLFFFIYYKVDEVEVMGSSHYSQEEIKDMVLRGPLASNSVLAPLLYTKKETVGIPFIQGYAVNQVNRNTICISVKEKKPVGCIPYLDSYVYFDRNGVFVESSRERDKTVPYFDGISVKHVVMDEPLPIKGDTVLNTAVALATIFQKNEMIPEHIQFDENYHISLRYGEIVVMLGQDKYLEDKMTRALAILPLISGKKGILHLDSVTDTIKTITFEEEKPVDKPDQEGSDQEGSDQESTGEEGTAEDDITEESISETDMNEKNSETEDWDGGYDEEGDYTGAGEYDANGNYVGTPSSGENPEENN